MVVASLKPMLFAAVHLYTDALSPLISSVKLRMLDVEIAELFPSLVHVMFGSGLPVALQNNITLLPSTTCWGVGAETISGGSTNSNHRTISNKIYDTSFYRKRIHLTALAMHKLKSFL